MGRRRVRRDELQGLAVLGHRPETDVDVGLGEPVGDEPLLELDRERLEDTRIDVVHRVDDGAGFRGAIGDGLDVRR